MSGMTAASRIVVKIGSSSLTREDGGLDLNRIDAVARLVSRWRGRDREVVIVSSGAVAAGLDPLGFSAKPKDLPSVQAAAAMGQGLLMARWTAAFQAHHLDAAQVLLTTDDVMRRDHYTNVRAALSRLLGLGVVPILNENDAVTTRELRFGDNDRLAALIAQMIKADALVLLTDVDGLYTAPPDHPGSELIERVASADDLMSVLVTGAGSRVGTGGMATKVQAAMLATASGIGVQLPAQTTWGPSWKAAASAPGSNRRPSVQPLVACGSHTWPPLAARSLSTRELRRRSRSARSLCWLLACTRCSVISRPGTLWTLPARPDSSRAACPAMTRTHWARSPARVWSSWWRQDTSIPGQQFIAMIWRC